MDDDTWYITLTTGFGGFIGWLNAKIEVNQLCTLEEDYWGDPIDICEDEVVLASVIEMVYPSSILTGLALGLLVGILYTHSKRYQRRDLKRGLKYTQTKKGRLLGNPKKSPPSSDYQFDIEDDIVE